MKATLTASLPALALLVVHSAHAQNGTPPTDEAAAVAQQKAAAALEENKPKPNSLAAQLNAGAQFATGNSQAIAITGGGKIDIRDGNNGFGAAFLANYATSFVQPVAPATQGTWTDTVRNLQGKVRYDRYFGRNVSIFLQVTGTHDAFQATTFRLNLDPGVKYLFVNHPKTKFWGEVGYDFEYDLNYTDADGFEQAGAGGKVLDTATPALPFVIQKTNTMHSARAYAGFQHAFNKEVQLSAGLEFLQGFGGSGDGLPAVPNGFTAAQVDLVKINLVRTRLNFDALLAAHIAGGVSLAAGFTAKYNSDPLPGKQNLDTTTTLSFIFAFSKPAPAAPEDKCATPPPAVPTSTPSTDAATQHPIDTTPTTTPTTPPANTAIAAFVDDASKPVDSAPWVELDESKEQTHAIAELMKSHPNMTVKIGSADTTAKADAVRTALVDGGIAATRITTEVHSGHTSLRVTAK